MKLPAIIAGAVFLAAGLSGCVSARAARQAWHEGYSAGTLTEAELSRRERDASRVACENELDALWRWRTISRNRFYTGDK